MDLFALYRLVTEEGGGFEEVTRNKAWKDLLGHFGLVYSKATMNSVYALKKVYQKHLLGFETKQFKGNGLQSRIGGQSSSADRQSDAMDRLAATWRKSRFEIPMPLKPSQHSVVSKKLSASLNQFEDIGDERYIAGGWQNRLSLCLASNLPNEIDWALNKLVKLAFMKPFPVNFVPNLVPALVEHLGSFFGQLRLSTSPLNFATTVNLDFSGPFRVHSLLDPPLFPSAEWQAQLERVLQSLHIIRNLSFVPDNAALFAKDYQILTVLAKGMAFPVATHFSEVKLCCLEIFANLAFFVPLRGELDFYLMCLKTLLFETDRAYILSVITAFIRLIGNSQNEKLMANLDTNVIQRLIQLLLVPDEEIIMAVLEFFYLFTICSPAVQAVPPPDANTPTAVVAENTPVATKPSESTATRITNCVRFNLVPLLMKFVFWKGHRAIAPHNELFSFPTSSATDGSKASALSAPSQQDLKAVHIDPNAVDPYKASLWLLKNFEPCKTHVVDFQIVYKQYTDHSNAQHSETSIDSKAVSYDELFHLMYSLFSSKGSLMVGYGGKRIQGVKPLADSALASIPGIGISPDSGPTNTTDDSMLVDVIGGDADGSKQSTLSSNVDDLIKDEDEAFKKPSTSSTTSQFPPSKQQSIPSTPTPSILQKSKYNLLTHDAKNSGAYQLMTADELRGIPLTALLVIRNIARHQNNRNFFWEYEHELVQLLLRPRYSKMAASILVELAV